MDLFHVIEDKTVILRSKGVYRQAKAYRRGDQLYAGFGVGFVKLCGANGTSNPNVSWEDTDVEHTKDRLGRPVVSVGQP